jgi:hypothetical protein
MAYIILALSALIPAVWLFLRRRDPIMVATFTLAAGLITSGDYIALGILNLYSYHTGLVGGDLPDSIMGVILAEWVFVPSMVVVVQSAWPGWVGVAVQTFMVTLVEVLFVRLGLFEHHRWSMWYTIIGFTIYFGFIDRFWQKAHQNGLATTWPMVAHRWFLGIFWWSVPMAPIGAIFHVMVSDLKLLPQYWPNQAVGHILTDGIWTGPVFFWVLMGGRERRWTRWGAAAIWFALLDVAVQAIGVRHFRAPWSPFRESVTRSAALACACLIDAWVQARVESGQIRRRVR